MTRKSRRMAVLLACGLGLGSAAALSLAAFSNDIVFFVTPSDLALKGIPGPQPAPGRLGRGRQRPAGRG